jgi:branched-chain amino acid transport system permease protein
MKIRSFNLNRGLIALFVVIGFLIPLGVGNPYLLHIFITIFIWTILSLGVRIVMIVGHLNGASATFMGIGAYTSGILAINLGWSFWVCLFISGVVAGVLAMAIGYPILRVKGAYFIMVTFGLSEIFTRICMMSTKLFGGPQGLLGIPRPEAIKIAGLTIAFSSKIPFYYLAFLLMLITLLVMYRIDASRLGMTFRAIPQSDVLAECVGVNVMAHKILAFVIGCFFSGVAGSFWAHYSSYASPWDFGWLSSLYMLIYVVIGGKATVLGPIVGCVALLILDEVLRPVQLYIPIFLGGILIGVLLFIPNGLISLPERVRSLIKG